MKRWFESRTFWMGALQMAIPIGEFVAKWVSEGVRLPESWILLFTGIAMIVLRKMTDSGMEFRSS